MIYIGAFVLLSLVTFSLLWVFWLVVSALSAADQAGKLTPTARKMGYVLYLIGYAIDIFSNILLMVWLLDIREFTVSARLQRYVRGEGWRKSFALWIADNWIDPFYWKPGEYHIKPNNVGGV